MLNSSLTKTVADMVGSLVSRRGVCLPRTTNSMWKPLVLMTLAAWPAVGTAGSVVCWSNRFAGLHEASSRAEAALGGTTRDLSRVAIYFEKVDGYYFYQSNYIPARERTAAKITSTEPMNMTTVLSNIILRRSPGTQVDGAALRMARNNVTVFSGEQVATASRGPASGRIDGVMLASFEDAQTR